MTPRPSRRRLLTLAVLVLTALPAVPITDADVAYAADEVREAQAQCPVPLPPLGLEVTIDGRGRLGWLVSPTTVGLSWRVPRWRVRIVVAHEVVHACWRATGKRWKDERAVQGEAKRWVARR